MSIQLPPNHLTIVANHYILMLKDAVLWNNRGKLFWVNMKASHLLHHVGVQTYLTRAGAARTAAHLGGSVHLENELHPAHLVSIVSSP